MFIEPHTTNADAITEIISKVEGIALRGGLACTTIITIARIVWGELRKDSRKVAERIEEDLDGTVHSRASRVHSPSPKPSNTAAPTR